MMQQYKAGNVVIIIIIIFFNDKLTSATHYNTKYTGNNVELIVNK